MGNVEKRTRPAAPEEIVTFGGDGDLFPASFLAVDW